MSYLSAALKTRDRTARFHFKAPNREQVVDWVTLAFGELSKDTIISGFVKTKLIDRPIATDNPLQEHENDEVLINLFNDLQIHNIEMEDVDDENDILD